MFPSLQLTAGSFKAKVARSIIDCELRGSCLSSRKSLSEAWIASGCGGVKAGGRGGGYCCKEAEKLQHGDAQGKTKWSEVKWKWTDVKEGEAAAKLQWSRSETECPGNCYPAWFGWLELWYFKSSSTRPLRYSWTTLPRERRLMCSWNDSDLF